ncbi:hypothetical protein BASA83_006970 [Batrachochytrium salamandrivorans]|nr:hypothetical protein BASA83_006970 [Batrachochytrium salamandrivorans]
MCSGSIHQSASHVFPSAHHWISLVGNNSQIYVKKGSDTSVPRRRSSSLCYSNSPITTVVINNYSSSNSDGSNSSNSNSSNSTNNGNNNNNNNNNTLILRTSSAVISTANPLPHHPSHSSYSPPCVTTGTTTTIPTGTTTIPTPTETTPTGTTAPTPFIHSVPSNYYPCSPLKSSSLLPNTQSHLPTANTTDTITTGSSSSSSHLILPTAVLLSPLRPLETSIPTTIPTTTSFSLSSMSVSDLNMSGRAALANNNNNSNSNNNNHHSSTTTDINSYYNKTGIHHNRDAASQVKPSLVDPIDFSGHHLHSLNDRSRHTDRPHPELKINVHAQYSSSSSVPQSPSYAFNTSFSVPLPFGLQKLLPTHKSWSPLSILPSWASSPSLSDFLTLDSVKFTIMCLLWYSFSALTSNSGKQILNEYKHPISLTYAQFGLVSICCALAASLRLGTTRLRPPTAEILWTTLPLAFFQIFGHIFSSVAMSFVSVSFANTIKALSPLFTILLYRAIYKIKYSSKVYLALAPLTMGVMLVCATELKFHSIGFLCALASTFIFVIQNVFSKKLFNNAASHAASDATKIDKINLLFYSATTAFILMFPIWAYYEAADFFSVDSAPLTAHLSFLFILNGIFNFLQSVMAFWILSLTSPVTYSIASLVKRIFVITASIFYFQDKVSVTQAAGISMTFFGLWLYGQAKREVSRAEVQISAIQETQSAYSLPSYTMLGKDSTDRE